MKLRDFGSWDDSDNYYWKGNETQTTVKKLMLFSNESFRTRKPELQTEVPSAPSFPALSSHPEWLAGDVCSVQRSRQGQDISGSKPCWSATAWTTARQGWAGVTRSFDALL